MSRSLCLLVLAALSLLLADVASAYANPKLCEGTCTNAHDPSIIRRDDGTYFRFSTGNKIAIHSAPAVTGPWKYVGALLPSGSKINLKGKDDLWAPDVRKVGKYYYVYYSVSSFGSQSSAVGLARSTTMDAGTWTDYGSAGITSDASKPYNAIDPNLFQVGSKYYMTFGSYWKGLYQVEMKSTPTGTASSATQLVASSNSEVVEAAYMFKSGNYYYLFFSKGSCCGYDQTRPASGKEYRILVCRSTSPTGAFKDKSGKSCASGGGTVVLASHGYVYGPGGQGVYQDPKYGPILYYHYVDTRVGYADGDKRFGWNQIDFSTGWPVV
jgi:arabinan endo-1,5-alpha-L-arabinosidase